MTAADSSGVRELVNATVPGGYDHVRGHALATAITQLAVEPNGRVVYEQIAQHGDL